MMHAVITPVMLDVSAASLCGRRYPGHPKGCPNLRRKKGCPPVSNVVSHIIARRKRQFVWTEFDIGAHATRMLRLHPNWSDRQAYCCLYWQAGARKRLHDEVELVVPKMKTWCVLYTPEAYGVNVTATLAKVGVELEWPPVKIARQVAMVLTR